jgi:hypothetical protein
MVSRKRLHVESLKGDPSLKHQLQHHHRDSVAWTDTGRRKFGAENQSLWLSSGKHGIYSD